MRKLPSILAGALAALALTPAPAAAVETVIQDDAALLHAKTSRLREHMQTIKGLGIERVRLTAGWSVIAPAPDATQRPDFDAADPAAYPPARWDHLDRAVRLATDAGLEVMVDIAFWAPRWATGAPSPQDYRERTNIDPTEYARFATAVARRYSGGYAPRDQWQEGDPEPPPPARKRTLFDLFVPRSEPESPQAPPPPPLPKVSMYTLWNEPNHPGFIYPQWERQDGEWVAVSADRYRELVYAGYPAVKAVASEATVLIGATSSMGSSTPGRGATPPLAFLRRLACVDDRLRPIRDGACAGFREIPGDGWSHHPYSLRTAPDAKPRNRDNAPVAAMPELSTLLDRLVRRGRLTPRNADIYLTEYGYETNPPDPRAPFGLRQQEGFLHRAEKIALAEPDVRMWPQFQLIDRPGDPAGPSNRPYGDWQSGLFFEDGRPKPAVGGYATPTSARCVWRKGRRWVELWARRRDEPSGRVGVQRRSARAWSTVRHRPRPRGRAAAARSAAVPGDHRGVSRYFLFRGSALYRAVWNDRATGETMVGPMVRPEGCARSARPGRRSTGR